MKQFVISRRLSEYLSEGQNGLIDTGIHLWEDLTHHPDLRVTDFSYLVFPFAKAYEGFLKQWMRDDGYIRPGDYENDHFRIGKSLNPSLEKQFRSESVYDQIIERTRDKGFADRLWNTWKRGRNLVFHYFPHNLKALSREEAESIIRDILGAMECVIEKRQFSQTIPQDRFQKSG